MDNSDNDLTPHKKSTRKYVVDSYHFFLYDIDVKFLYICYEVPKQNILEAHDIEDFGVSFSIPLFFRSFEYPVCKSIN